MSGMLRAPPAPDKKGGVGGSACTRAATGHPPSMSPPLWKRLLPGADSLLLRSLRGTEWSQLADYVSPSFFEVLRPRQILGRVRELVANASDKEGFARAAARTGEALAARGVPVDVTTEGLGESQALAPGSEAERRALGQRVLETFFAQLLGAETAILDLRPGRFTGSAAEPRWAPQPFWVAWDPEFLAALRELYAGHYEGDDARFQDALVRLDLEPAEDVFRAHFGEGDDQRAVRFRARDFHETFHEAFVRCRDAGASLHPDFLSLGIALACLYDHLETLDLAFDVRAAWEHAAGR